MVQLGVLGALPPRPLASPPEYLQKDESARGFDPPRVRAFCGALVSLLCRAVPWDVRRESGPGMGLGGVCAEKHLAGGGAMGFY